VVCLVGRLSSCVWGDFAHVADPVDPVAADDQSGDGQRQTTGCQDEWPGPCAATLLCGVQDHVDYSCDLRWDVALVLPASANLHTFPSDSWRLLRYDLVAWVFVTSLKNKKLAETLLLAISQNFIFYHSWQKSYCKNIINFATNYLLAKFSSTLKWIIFRINSRGRGLLYTKWMVPLAVS